MSRSIQNFIRERRNGRKRQLPLPSWNEDFIYRLGISTILEGHTGCVNCIEWDRDGTLLVSGSDDQYIRIWRPHAVGKPFRRSEQEPANLEQEFKMIKNKIKDKQILISLIEQPVSVRNVVSPITSIKTPHTRNIFATRFFDNQSKIVSGAADHHVHVTDLTTQEVCYTKSFENRVKKVSVVDNYVFLSAVEDGTVQLSDVRVGASYPIFSISSSNLPRVANIAEVKSIDYHKRTNMVAVGSGGGLVRIFDVRFDKEPTMKLMFGKMYFPGHCDRDRGNYSVTHVAFSEDGSELLANMGSEHVYLYDVKNPTLTSLKLPDIDSSPEEPPPLPEKAEKLKATGNYLFSESQFFGAYQNYLDALWSCPEHPILLNNAASALMNRKIIGDKYESFLFCQRALKKHSKYRKARIRAIKLLRNIDLLAAKAEAEKLLEYDLQNSDKKEVAASRKILDGILKVLDDIPDDEDEEEDGSAPIWLDYKNRFVGHYNCQTDIKEASFLGSEFIAAGSDCGNLFVWRRNGKLLFIAKADENILNCVQPNPKLTSIATSGIDNEIKLWQPVDESLSDSYNDIDSSNGMAEHVEENSEFLRQHIRQDTELLAHMNSQYCVQQ